MTTRAQADAIIDDHVLFAAAASALPVPFLDVGAVMAVQLDMLAGLADTYDVRYSTSLGKAAISSLAGSTLPRMGASLVKGLPGVGWLVGGATQVALSGASTYALGQVFRRHFEDRRDLTDLDPDEVRASYRRWYGRGRHVVLLLRRRAAGPGARAAEPAQAAHAAIDTEEARIRSLRSLGELCDRGVITRDELERLKLRATRS